MQACVEFFTKRIINQALTRHAGKTLERGGVHRKMVVGFPTRTRAGMARVLARLIRQDKVNGGKKFAKLRFYTRSPRKLRFVLCQFLVRLTSGAHNRRSDGRYVFLPSKVRGHSRQEGRQGRRREG